MRRVLALTALVPLLAALPVGTAHADNTNRYNLSAEGNGMFFEYLGTAAPATDNLSASPWASFSAVNSQGNSRAFAGLPYFGAFLQTIGATVNGLSGGATPPIPPFPGYVETKYPATPEASEAQGPYVIKAASTDVESKASVASGFSPDAANPRQQIFSTARSIANPDGSTLSVATAGVEGVTMGPLTIARFQTSEQITESGDGKPVFKHSTELGTFEVAGFRVGVDDNGFTLAGNTTNVPASVVFNTINTTLAASGLELSYIPRTVTKDKDTGITTALSSAMRVRQYYDAPAVGPTTLTYVFGRSKVSSVDEKDTFGSGLLPDLPSVPEVTPGVDVGTGGSTGGSTGGAVDGGVVTAPIDTGTTVEPGLPSVDTGVPPAVTTDTGSTPVAGGQPNTRQVLGLVPASLPDANNTSLLYLVMVLAGAGVLVGQQLFSRFGVQLMLRA